MRYNILDNGGHPYIVEILDDKSDKLLSKVYDNYKFEEDEDNFIEPKQLEPELVMEINPIEIFIGKSPKNKQTEFSNGYGKNFDGNTILFDVGDNEYIFINRNIESFKSKAKIVKYVSPVGNSGVPYPYAIDEKGNYYLLIENVIFKPEESEDLSFDPYEYYYDNISRFSEYYINNKKYNMNYYTEPEINFKRITQNMKKKLYILDKDNNKVECNIDCFCDIMKKHAKTHKLKNIKKKILFTNF